MRVLQFTSSGVLQEVQVASALATVNWTKENLFITPEILTAGKLQLAGTCVQNSSNLTISGVKMAEFIDYDIFTDELTGVSELNFGPTLSASGIHPLEANDQLTIEYALEPNSAEIEFRKLNATLEQVDVDNGYIDLPDEAQELSVKIFLDGVSLVEAFDYSVLTVNNLTRIVFTGDLAADGLSKIEVGDFVSVSYSVIL